MAKIARLDKRLGAGNTGLVLFDTLNGYLHPSNDPAKVEFLRRYKVLANLQRGGTIMTSSWNACSLAWPG